MENKSPQPDNSDFTFFWNLFIGDISTRDNFKSGHLEHLRILCQLFTEFDKLTLLIEEEGYTYESMTRNGLQKKVTPEVTLRKEIMLEIRMYSKMLGLILEKDKLMNIEEATNDWK